MSNSPILVILDLDHTLLYCPDDNEPPVDRKPDFFSASEPVYVRPHVNSLISNLRSDENFLLGVWTAAGEDRAESYLYGLGVDKAELAVYLTKEHCTKTSADAGWTSFGEYILRKDLRRVVKNTGHSLERIIAVDDNQDVYWRHFGNLVKVPKYHGDASDNALDRLYPFLKYLHKQENVRTIDKRGWNSSSMREDGAIEKVFQF